MKMDTEEKEELKSLLKTERENHALAIKTIENLKTQQKKLQGSNKKLRKNLAVLSKGAQITEDILERAERYKHERDLLAEEVERLRDRVIHFKICDKSVNSFP